MNAAFNDKEEKKQDEGYAQEGEHGEPWHKVTLDDDHYVLKVFADNYVVLKVGGNTVYNGIQPPPPPKP